MASGEAPYLRNGWARAAYGRMKHQLLHQDNNHTDWYSVKSKELTRELNKTFVQLDQDPETNKFIDNSFEKSDWIFVQIYHSLAKSLLTWFMTHTSANGLLYRGSMFVFSATQFRSLLGVDDTWRAARLLDLGAGDGNVTLQIAPMFDSVDVTEVSPVMRWRLRKQGFNVVDVDSWSSQGVQYDVITCLNLLDRCDRPISLLREMRTALTPDTGRLVLALVMPFKQYVEVNSDHAASEKLHIEPSFFESQVSQLVSNVLIPVGFEVVSWTKMPYLCEGDMARGFYHLIDVVLVLKAVPLPRSQSSTL